MRLTTIVSFFAAAILLAGCGQTVEQQAATGGVAGAAVGGLPGAAVGALGGVAAGHARR